MINVSIVLEKFITVKKYVPGIEKRRLDSGVLLDAHILDISVIID